MQFLGPDLQDRNGFSAFTVDIAGLFGARDGWDFVRGVWRRNWAGLVDLASDARWSFSRASVATALSAAGVLTPISSGAVAQTDRGLLVQASRQNKGQGYNANPTVTTGITLSGDAAATLTVVDDTAALAAAGLQLVCTSGKVFKFDNSAGVATAYAVLPGAIGNTNQHIQSCYGRGSGSWAFGLHAGVDSGGVGLASLAATYARRAGSPGAVPTSTSGAMRIQVQAGTVLYFILFQLEEGSSATSPIIIAGSAQTRQVDNAAFTASIAAGQDFTESGEVELTKAATTDTVFVELHDGSDNNRVYVERSSGGSVRAYVVVGGVSTQIGSSVSKTGARTVKYAVTRSGDVYALYVDGAQAGSNTTVASLPALTGRQLGAHRAAASGHLNDYVRVERNTTSAMVAAQVGGMTT